MTVREAIALIGYHREYMYGRGRQSLCQALEMAEEALQKQMTIRPKHYDDVEQFYIECPTCNKRFDSRFKYKDCTQRCPYCSQAISLHVESEATDNVDGND